MAEKDADWQDKARQYLRAEKKQLEDEEREAEMVKRRRERTTDTPKGD